MKRSSQTSKPTNERINNLFHVLIRNISNIHSFKKYFLHKGHRIYVVETISFDITISAVILFVYYRESLPHHCRAVDQFSVWYQHRSK